LRVSVGPIVVRYNNSDIDPLFRRERPVNGLWRPMTRAAQTKSLRRGRHDLDDRHAPAHGVDDRAGVGQAVSEARRGHDASAPDAQRQPRRLLVIASRFPPVASVGATRVRKFVKYLEHDGWHATVITGAMRRRPTRSHDARRASDFESLADIPPSTAVHRLSPVVDAWPAFAARYAAARLAAITQFVGCHESYWTAKLRWRFDRIHNALAFPDRGVFRLPQAVALACRLHRARPFDAMLSSGMPFSDHLIALVLQNHLRLPWLADFRDPWVEYIHWKQWRSTPGLKLTRAAERVVVRRASFVISVNDHMTERFGLRYRRVPATKFVTLPNGFDPADFPEHRREQPSSRFHLLYAG
jgi:hypothetical protein